LREHYKDGLKRGDSISLEPFSAWVFGSIEDDRAFDYLCDIAQHLCEEVNQLLGSAEGREHLRKVRNVPGFLFTLADRCERVALRTELRYRAKIRKVALGGRVPAPWERLDGSELADVVVRALKRLSPQARTALALKRQGLSCRAIAQRLWHRAAAGQEDRVEALLEMARNAIRAALRRASAAVSPPRRKKRRP